MNERQILDNVAVLENGVFALDNPGLEAESSIPLPNYRHPVLDELTHRKEEIRHLVSGASREAEKDPLTALSWLSEQVQPMLQEYAIVWSDCERYLETDICKRITGSSEYQKFGAEERRFLQKQLRAWLKQNPDWEWETLGSRLEECLAELNELFDENPYDETSVSVEDYASRLNSIGYRMGFPNSKKAAAGAFQEYVQGIWHTVRTMDEEGQRAMIRGVMNKLLK